MLNTFLFVFEAIFCFKELVLKKKAGETLAATDTVIVAGLTALADCTTKVGTITAINGLINDALLECKGAVAPAAPAAAAAPVDPAAPAAPAEDSNPTDAALVTATGPVIEQLKTIKCQKQRRDIVGLMMIKKAMDAIASCQDEMVKSADEEEAPAAPAAR